ncbi:MAG: ABC transporter permease [Sedimentibacter sp.]
MRIINLIIGDARFQFKYGFYFVYLIFTVLYITLIHFLPLSWREKAAAILIFTDPAAMGIFFMGAIILFEKSERVLNSIAVSPVKVGEYIFSKVISLGFISAIVGITVALIANINNLFTVLIGIFLGSALFTLLGITAAANIRSLNQFIVATVPIEIISFLPPMFYMFGCDNIFMLIHPGCIIIRFISGNNDQMLLLSFVLCFWIWVTYTVAHKYIQRMFLNVGGITL